MKPELLAPAGNMECLKAAIHNGADAIYLSGKNYGARAFAKNFTNEEIKEAIKYAHIYDVKVYVTANTLIYEEEVPNFIEYIKFLYLSGVDAVLMQDIGMINLVKNIIPGLEIHASTQTNNCNDETLEFFKNLGIKRVVLARELSLDQITNLKTDIEKEVFIHGALCISYSGCCLFSSLNGSRSGNRGQCAGPCRLPYTLIKDNKIVKTEGKYLLSPKELNTKDKIKELLNSNIQSLKIEGRLKSKEYVAFVTKMYRNLIDNNYNQKNTDKNLKLLFNRGFTEGHLFQTQNLLNIKSPNHIGIEIGKVIEAGKKIKIKLKDNLSQNDGIRFQESGKGLIINKLYNKKGLLINNANKNEIIYIDNKIGLATNDTVLKTTDYNLNKNLSKYKEKKIKVNFKVEAYINKPLKITVYDKKHKITKTGNIVTKAITNNTTKEIITSKISQLGNTPFILDNIEIKMDDNVFIRINELKNLRRNIIETLIEEKTKIDRNIQNMNYNFKNKINKNKININVSVTNENQLKTVLNKVDNIYTSNKHLYNKYNNIYLKLDRTLYNLPDLNNEKLLIGNLGQFYKYNKNNNIKIDYFLNISNSYSCNFFNKPTTISPELSTNEITNISNKINTTEVIIYGKLELMIINYKIINDYTENSKYYLKNNKNEKFPIYFKDNKTHIIHYKPLNLINQIDYLKNNNINNFRLEFTDETPKEINNILNKVKRIINQ